MLIVVVLLATVAMRVAIVTVVVYLLLPQGRFCPHCGGEMTAIRNPFFDPGVSALERRWCGGWGGGGIGRRGPAGSRRPARRGGPAVPGDRGVPDDFPPRRAGRLQLRRHRPSPLPCRRQPERRRERNGLGARGPDERARGNHFSALQGDPRAVEV